MRGSAPQGRGGGAERGFPLPPQRKGKEGRAGPAWLREGSGEGRAPRRGAGRWRAALPRRALNTPPWGQKQAAAERG